MAYTDTYASIRKHERKSGKNRTYTHEYIKTHINQSKYLRSHYWLRHSPCKLLFIVCCSCSVCYKVFFKITLECCANFLKWIFDSTHVWMYKYLCVWFYACLCVGVYKSLLNLNGNLRLILCLRLRHLKCLI